MKRFVYTLAAIFFVMYPSAMGGTAKALLDTEYWLTLDPQRLVVLLDKVETLDFSDGEGRTPLHAAAQAASPETFAVLLDRWRAEGLPLDPRDREGFTPLMVAAYATPYPEILRKLVSAGADLDLAGPDGETALHFAARGNPKTDILGTLIDLGGALEAEDVDGWTPLLTAAYSGSAQKIALLLAAGAHLDHRARKGGVTALHLAAANASGPEPVRVLLKAGLSPSELSAEGWTPVFSAAINPNPGAVEILEVLLDSGGSLGSTGKYGETPLHIVVQQRQGRPKLVAFMLERGADVQARDRFGWVPLHGAAAVGRSSAVVRLLVEAGSDLEARTANQETPLIMLAKQGASLEVARTLVDLGADVNATGRWGWSLLHYAAADGSFYLKVADWVELGADVHARNTLGETPLHVAARLQKDPDVLRALVELGADLEARDGNGWTPFLSAARGAVSSGTLLQTLADLGADVNARSELGRNALHIAAQYADYPEPIELLVQLGVDATVQDVGGNYPWNLLLKNPRLADAAVSQDLSPEVHNTEGR